GSSASRLELSCALSNPISGPNVPHSAHGWSCRMSSGGGCPAIASSMSSVSPFTAPATQAAVSSRSPGSLCDRTASLSACRRRGGGLVLALVQQSAGDATRATLGQLLGEIELVLLEVARRGEGDEQAADAARP